MIRLIVTAAKLNKRKFIPAQLPEPDGVAGVVFKNFEFQGEEVSDASIPNPSMGKWYKDTDNYFYWAGGVNVSPPPIVTSTASSLLAPPIVMPHDMPLGRNSCIKCAGWMKANFETKITDAVKSTPFDKELIYAIACQETAYRWLLWIEEFSTEDILQRCVFDASGDFPDTSRSAFPKNKAELTAEFGNDITDMLINEANKMRAMPQPGHDEGFQPANYLYKGYGIFQYDLQFIKEDKDFFVKKQWYAIDECIKRVMKELNAKWARHPNDMFNTVKAYNGSGSAAEQYAQKVSQFYTWIKAI
jgi:hypothetical protein